MSTIGKSEAPWESYGKSLEEKLDPKLEAEVNEYAQKRHTKTSEQNAEELVRWEEENKQIAKQYQFLSPEEYQDEGARIGKVLHASQFINILRRDFKLNCHYRRHPHEDKLTLIVIRNQKPEVACWTARNWMPEYSIVRFDDHDVPLNERFRGWRTCLLQMILKGILKEEDANRVFGRAQGPASTRYNSLLYAVRNREAKVV
jgi:hypothetical protein